MTWRETMLAAFLVGTLALAGFVQPAMMLMGFLIGYNIGWLHKQYQDMRH